MEFIAIIVFLAVFSVPVLLIWLAVRSSKQVKDLSWRLDRLEQDFRELRDQFGSRREAEQETEAPAAESPTDSISARVQKVATPVHTDSHSEERPISPPLLPPLVVPPRLRQTVSPRRAVPSAPPLIEASPSDSRAQRWQIDWEQFLGVKLFSWIGGLALLLGIAFFVKYSFEHNLIPPEVRVALGFLAGMGLLAGGIGLRRKEYAVTAQTLTATGVVVLYAVSFAAHGVYHLIGSILVFFLMVAITATAFLLATRMDAKVVAVLGLLGGFLTPPLLSTGEDNPFGLFGYIALLDIGLMAVALHRRWYFLILLSASSTLLMEFGWANRFFEPEKIVIADAVFSTFNLLFLGGYFAGEKLGRSHQKLTVSALLLPFATIGFGFFLLSYSSLASWPGAMLILVLVADLCLLAIAAKGEQLSRVPGLAGTAVFLFLAMWSKFHFIEANLPWILAAILVFASLHTVFPVLLQRWRPRVAAPFLGDLFPPMALLIVLVPVLQLDHVSFLLWPFVLMIDVLAIGLALLTGSLVSVLAVILGTLVVMAFWIARIPPQWPSLWAMLLVVGSFALFFVFGGLWALKRTAGKSDPNWTLPPEWQKQIPAFGAILPFLLLGLMALRFPITNPSSLFGMALLLSVLTLGLARFSSADALALVGLLACLSVEYIWHKSDYSAVSAGIALGWYVIFYLLFTLFPFAVARQFRTKTLPWVGAALSGPLHFYLIYQAFGGLLENFPYMGLIPAVLTIPPLIGLRLFISKIELDAAQRIRLLAWFGGSALFFITLVFPIQFERQWITLGWALEGVALAWLYLRVPHRGLPLVGVGLLIVAFARLALNPKVFQYHPRSEIPILNWYLYSYGIATLCFFFTAKLLTPPRNIILKKNVLPLLYTLGTILAFLLLNLEIADYFSDGPFLRFQFTGNFARDMSYSIGWGLFALGLLLIGVQKEVRAARYASLALLSVTLLKLFFHDLSRLGQLYRIGAFIGVAIILFVASWIYQRFLSIQNGAKKR